MTSRLATMLAVTSALAALECGKPNASYGPASTVENTSSSSSAGSGGAGGSCAGAGVTVCDAACVDTTVNASHCGMCENACNAGETCASSTCQCAGGEACAAGLLCTATGCAGWAAWPMPNPPGVGLPNPASYSYAIPGVVIDQVTGLWWQEPIDMQNDKGETCAPGCTQQEALAYCADLTLAGYSDWRLPNRIELMSIVDFTRHGPAIDTTSFPSTPIETFWTRSPFAGDPAVAWLLNFDLGNTIYDSVLDASRVRCVR